MDADISDHYCRIGGSVGNHCGSFMLWLWRGVRRNEPRCLLVLAATGVRRVDEAADAQPDVACGVVWSSMMSLASAGTGQAGQAS
jgi:hypothetical protein